MQLQELGFMVHIKQTKHKTANTDAQRLVLTLDDQENLVVCLKPTPVYLLMCKNELKPFQPLSVFRSTDFQTMHLVFETCVDQRWWRYFRLFDLLLVVRVLVVGGLNV